MTDADWEHMAGAGLESFKLSHRGRALFLLSDIDLDAQLIAIRGALRRNREADAQVSEEIEQFVSQIRTYAGGNQEYRMYMEGHWVDMVHGTVFQDAAHSMSAVGMLTPFIESLFVSIFRAMQKHIQILDAADPRSKADPDQYWNPKIVYGKNGPREDIVAGIKQLAILTGLHRFMPNDYQKILTALFAYRNNMLHNGFEWPSEKRMKFANRIKEKSWPDTWFSQAMRGGEPWVFYMSSDFIETILELIDQVLESFGKYLENNELPAKRSLNIGES